MRRVLRLIGSRSARAFHSSLALAVALFAAPAIAQHVLISGQVADTGGRPIAGAAVRLLPARSSYEHLLDSSPLLRPERQALAEGRTDETGRYRLDAEEGVFRVEVSAPGYATVVHYPLAFVEPRELPLLHLPQARTEPLRVQVLRPGGAPAAGAGVRVTVSDRNGDPFLAASPPWSLETVRGETGEDGSVRLEVPAGEEYSVSAALAGFATAFEETSGDRLTLRLAEASPVPVEVRDSRGRPVAGAVVTTGPAIALTGEDGRASLPLHAEAKEIDGGRVAAPSGALGPLPPLDRAALAELRRDPEHTEPIVIILDEPELVSGQVLERGTYEPVGGALVWSRSDPAHPTRTGGGGGFEILAGEGLEAAAPGYVLDDSMLSRARHNEQQEPILFLVPAASLSGRVTDRRGRPVPGASLAAVGRLDMFAIHSASSGEDGRFVLFGLPAGETMIVAARHVDYATTLEEASVPHRGEPAAELHLVLGAGATLHGRVEDPNEQPVAGATVGLRTARNRSSFAMTPGFLVPEEEPRSAVTDEAGRYRFAGEVPRLVYLSAQARGFASVTLGELELEGEVERNVRLEPGARLEGRVVDGEGTPVPGAWLRASVAGRSSFDGPSATSDESGRFVLEGLPRDALVNLSVTHRDYVHEGGKTVRMPYEEPLVVVLERPARVAGTVVDDEGRPVPGATLEVTVLESPFQRSGTSRSVDDDGRFDLPVGPGTVELVASTAGRAPSRPIHLELERGESVSDLELVLAAGEADLEGTVTDAEGQPVPHATVTLRDRAPMANAHAGATTDGDGRFRLGGLPVGRQSLLLSADGQPTTLRDVTLEAGPNTAELRFDRGWSISGRVIDGEGLPLQGVHVESRGQIEIPSRFPEPPVVSAADGRFSLRGLGAGSYSLRFSREGRILESLGPVLLGDGPIDVGEIRLGGGALVGLVRGLEPAFRPEAQVTVERLARTSSWQRGPTTLPLFRLTGLDAEGRFRIEDLPPGRYGVNGRLASRGRSDHTEVVLEEGVPEAPVELDLSPGLRLSGTVMSRGRPVAGAWVRVHRIQSAPGAYAAADGDGRFQFDGLDPGRYQLSATPRDGAFPHEMDLELGADLKVTVELESADLSGEVRERATGAPIAGALIFVAPAAKLGSRRPLTRSGRDGSFSVFSLPAGSYRIRAVAEGFSEAEIETEIEPPGRDGVVLELGPAGRAALRVHDADGRRVPRVMIRVRAENGQILLDDFVTTGEDGYVELTTLPPGRHETFVTATDGAGARTTVEVGGPTALVTLPAVGALVISIPALRASRSEADLELVSPEGDPLRLLQNGQEEIRWRVHDGSHRLQGVPTGRWRIRVTTENGESFGADAVVRAAETTEVVVR